MIIDNITIDNLHLGCQADDKNEVLSMIGKVFKEKGYVNQNCINLLAEREKQVSTFLGNGITLPHLPKSAANIIKNTGVEIFQFPEGIMWDRGKVMFIAVGVVAKEKEHIEILKDIASIFNDEIIANILAILSSKHDFLRIFTKKDPL